MSGLASELRLSDSDGFYAELVALYDGLDPEAQMAASARLILLLANQIGDHDILREAIAESRRLAAPASPR